MTDKTIGEEFDERRKNIAYPRQNETEETIDVWMKALDELDQEFKQKLLEQHGLTDHPSVNICFGMAMDYGYSSKQHPYSEVEKHFTEFSRLLEWKK